MDFSNLGLLCVFLASGLITPGPNTMMLLASGVNFGIKRSMPHWSGVVIGTMLLFFSVSFGVAKLMELYPQARVVVQILGLLYMLYLAWKVASASGFSDKQSGTPLTFFQAIMIQALNVKLMGIAATASTLFPLASTSFANSVALGIVAGLVNGPCVGTWLVSGTVLKRVLSDIRIRRIFNFVLAGAIILTLVPVVWEIWDSLQNGF